ncbi:MAG TPA: hypothetical protein VLI71_05775 [Gammaproteobacteria bacterium]|nr:hypothetical protein [Gammaproteobacteria bacterium]
MSQFVVYRCMGCGKKIQAQRGLRPIQLKHELHVPGSRLLCGLFLRPKEAPREVREAWRAIEQAEQRALEPAAGEAH